MVCLSNSDRDNSLGSSKDDERRRQDLRPLKELTLSRASVDESLISKWGVVEAAEDEESEYENVHTNNLFLGEESDPEGDREMEGVQ